MADILTTQAGLMSVIEQDQASFLHASQLGTLVVFNIPAENVLASQMGLMVATQSANLTQVSQLGAMVVIRGRVYNPKLRAWAFTLDGHDFYVLRLAEGKTLVYDLTTKQCSWWTTGDFEFWRPTVGMNWLSAGTIPNTFGSNVICLDDTFGHVWILNPDQAYDVSPVDTASPERFPRVATAQLITRQREFIPVYEVYLTADFGEPLEDGDLVTLQYSDDRANTFVSAGGMAVTTGDYGLEVAWRSLGIVQPPGRIFQLSDDGAVARVDGLDVSAGDS